MVSDKIIYYNEVTQAKRIQENIFDITVEKIFSDYNKEEVKEELATSLKMLQGNVSESEFATFYDNYINCVINILEYIDDVNRVYWIKKDDDSSPRIIEDKENKTLYFETGNKTDKVDNALWIFEYANEKYGIKTVNKEYKRM